MQQIQRGICTITMQKTKESDLHSKSKGQAKEREKKKDIDILPTENAKKEPPPCRN
jgi:hypothetical protein